MEQEAVTGNVRVSWVSARAAAGDEAWELYGGWCAHTYGLAICACGNRLRAGVHTGCMVAHVIGACCEWAGCPRKGWTVSWGDDQKTTVKRSLVGIKIYSVLRGLPTRGSVVTAVDPGRFEGEDGGRWTGMRW